MSETATAETKVEIDDIYNDLSLDEQDHYDAIAARGFKPVQNGNKWSGEPTTDGQDRVGPCPDLESLAQLVEGLVGDPFAETDLEDDSETEDEDDGFRLDGEPSEKTGKTHKVKQPLLPNTKNAVIQDLRSAILGYRATTMDIIDLQARQKDEKKLVLALMHKFEDQLSVDRETGEKFFQVETIRCYLTVKEVENLRTEAVSNA